MDDTNKHSRSDLPLTESSLFVVRNSPGKTLALRPYSRPTSVALNDDFDRATGSSLSVASQRTDIEDPLTSSAPPVRHRPLALSNNFAATSTPRTARNPWNTEGSFGPHPGNITLDDTYHVESVSFPTSCVASEIEHRRYSKITSTSLDEDFDVMSEYIGTSDENSVAPSKTIRRKHAHDTSKRLTPVHSRRGPELDKSNTRDLDQYMSEWVQPYGTYTDEMGRVQPDRESTLLASSGIVINPHADTEDGEIKLVQHRVLEDGPVKTVTLWRETTASRQNRVKELLRLKDRGKVSDDGSETSVARKGKAGGSGHDPRLSLSEIRTSGTDAGNANNYQRTESFRAQSIKTASESPPSLSLARFLASCEPPLLHLFPILESLGVRKEERLLALARLNEETRDRDFKDEALRLGITVVEWAILMEKLQSTFLH